MLAGHRIDGLIGEGGMGAVYRATHLRLRRVVALKVLPPALAADAEYRRRFEREAAIAASLEHPAVVPIYDAGHDRGVLYLSMRLVDGEDLGVVLQREGMFDVERLCALLAPVADALDALHEAGLVHRDVKPGNVLVARPTRTRAGQVYLCDFGIAKGTDAGNEITSAGQYVGTVQYSSPEQIQGAWVDGRSDQYGLACLVYRGLTGQVPYPRDGTPAVIYAHLAAEPPRPSLVNRGLPPAVDAVLVRAMAKNPEHRFPSCAAFIGALRSAGVAHRRPVAPPVGATRAPTGTRDPGPSWPPVGSAAPAPARAPGAPVPAPAPAPVESSAPAPTRTPSPTPRPIPRPAPETPPETPAPVVQPPDTTGPGQVGEVQAVADVRAERATGEPSVTITWTAMGDDVEYKVTRVAPDGQRRVVGRTRATAIIDGAVGPGDEIPAYEVVARGGVGNPPPTRVAETPAPGDIPPITGLAITPTGTLSFDWPTGVTEAMVVVRHDQPPVSSGDPEATSWKITNMRYQLDGGLLLPASVTLPCHVAVASCRRERGTLVVAPGFGPEARVTVEK